MQLLQKNNGYYHTGNIYKTIEYDTLYINWSNWQSISKNEDEDIKEYECRDVADLEKYPNLFEQTYEIF
jgi:hypothetical protein